MKIRLLASGVAQPSHSKILQGQPQWARSWTVGVKVTDVVQIDPNEPVSAVAQDALGSHHEVHRLPRLGGVRNQFRRAAKGAAEESSTAYSRSF
jgi:hypothetical protein